MELSALPVEIFEDIFSQNLTLRDLRRLATVSKGCHSVAHSITLFRRKYLKNGSFDKLCVGSVFAIHLRTVATAWPHVPFVARFSTKSYLKQGTFLAAPLLAKNQNIIGLSYREELGFYVQLIVKNLATFSQLQVLE